VEPTCILIFVLLGFAVCYTLSKLHGKSKWLNM